VAHLVPGALVTTSLANVSTALADSFGIFAFARHKAGGQAAYLGAVHIGRNAASHHFYVLLLQTGRCTKVTGVGTGVASVNTRRVL
jgi:hypothetical protein